MRGLGTIVNVVAVLVGGSIGLLLKNGIKKRFEETMMQVLGLATIFIGLGGALKGIFVVQQQTLETTKTMMMIISLVVGAIIGEWINIEERLEHFGEWLNHRVKRNGNQHFVEGFVTASLITCVGAMAVVGSLQDGLTGDASMLYAKSTLDFVVVLVIAATLGMGVLFCALPIGIYQGGITLFATFVAPFLSDERIANLSFVGSILIFGIGINLAFGKRLKVGNMLPALIVALFFT